MYCPKCGQAQYSADAQFCNRCGLSLRIVKELVLTDGALAVTSDCGFKAIRRWREQKGMRLGAKLIFWGLISIPLTFGLSVMADGPFFLFVSVAVVLAGIARIVYARLFENHEPYRSLGTFREPAPVAFGFLGDSPAKADLFVPPPRETGAPPSVTDHTTRFLD